jgi:uncharacterized protein (TIGR03083 family)
MTQRELRLPPPEEPVRKDELLERVRHDRAEWEALVARIPRERLTEPGLPGGWSVKDTMAHIAWGEREAFGVMRARALAGSDLWNLPQDERNAAVFEQNRHRPLEDVLAEHERTFTEFLAALEELTEDDLNDPARFPPLAEVIPGWRPWRVLYDPDHYTSHGQDVHAWLERNPLARRGGQKDGER